MNFRHPFQPGLLHDSVGSKYTAESDKFSEHAGIFTGTSLQPQKAVPPHEFTGFL